jgi:hypothetical protein
MVAETDRVPVAVYAGDSDRERKVAGCHEDIPLSLQ